MCIWTGDEGQDAMPEAPKRMILRCSDCGFGRPVRPGLSPPSPPECQAIRCPQCGKAGTTTAVSA